MWAAVVSPTFAMSPADSIAVSDTSDITAVRVNAADSAQVLIAMCTKMLRESPHNVPVRLRRAALYQWMGADEKALSDYNLILEDQPSCEDALLFRADIYRRQRSFRLARADYERLIQIRPSNLKACLGLAITNDESGRPREAMDQMNVIVEAWPEEALPYLVRGEMFMRRGIYPQALMDFDESIRLDPTNPDAYLSRGIYYKHRRKSSLAREDFRRAVELGADANYVYSLLRDLR